jgi:anti-anti-sigma factor
MAAHPLVIVIQTAELDLANQDEYLAALAPALETRDVIVDLSGVTFMDSTCLGKRVAMRKERKAREFPPAVIAASERVRRLLHIVAFDKLWPVFDSLEEGKHYSATSAPSNEPTA